MQDSVPAEYISKLFDDYALSFESSLHELKYIVPSIIVNELHKSHKVFYSILDLGSGTGLLGDEITKSNLTNCMIGLDLSRKMLEVSLEKKTYNILVSTDILTFLSKMHSDKILYDELMEPRREYFLRYFASLVFDVEELKNINVYELFSDTKKSVSSAIVAADVFGKYRNQKLSNNEIFVLCFTHTIYHIPFFLSQMHNLLRLQHS